LVVLLNREHDYQDLERVKAELSGKVLELAPKERSNKEVPFLRLVAIGSNHHQLLSSV
jgi:hypothetical protein